MSEPSETIDYGTYIEVKNAPNPTQAITVSCQVKSAMENWNEHGMLISKRDAFMLFPLLNSKILRFYIYSKVWKFAEAELSVDITESHHYAGTFDGQDIRLYVDGEEVARTPFIGKINKDLGSMFIGKDDGYDYYLQGTISDVRIWDKSLTSEEIKNSMSQGVREQDTHLLGHWAEKKPEATIDPETDQTKPFMLKSAEGELFASVADNQATAGNTLFGYIKTGGDGQKWSFSDGLIKSSLGDFVLDLGDLPGNEWAKLVVINTPNGSETQRWEIHDNGVIKNKSMIHGYAYSMAIDLQNFAIMIAYPVNEAQLEATQKWEKIPT
jgi:hypothetical protein